MKPSNLSKEQNQPPKGLVYHVYLTQWAMFTSLGSVALTYSF